MVLEIKEALMFVWKFHQDMEHLEKADSVRNIAERAEASLYDYRVARRACIEYIHYYVALKRRQLYKDDTHINKIKSNIYLLEIFISYVKYQSKEYYNDRHDQILSMEDWANEQ